MEKKIVLPAPHPRLRPRRKNWRGTRAGSAVTIDEVTYEVMSVVREDDQYVYTLSPWKPDLKMRHHVTWTEELEETFRMQCRLNAETLPRGNLLFPMQILVGFFPASTQKELTDRWEFDPGRATLWSSLFQFFLTFPLFFYETLLHTVGQTILPMWLWIVVGYSAVESALRASSALIFDEPVGTLFLFFFQTHKPRAGKQDLYADVLTRHETQLLVVTHFPKPHWEKQGGVTFEGMPYRFDSKKIIMYSTLYIFKATHETADFPELDLARERSWNIASDRSYVYAPLWGFLSHHRQRSIEIYGRYRSTRFTLFSTFCVGFIFLPMMIYDIAQFALQVPGIHSYIRLPVALYFIHESLLRIYRVLRDREPSGSLLGVALIPLARIFFREANS